MNVYVVMGVSGCGKTSVGKRLAAELGVPFFEGDDYHPDSNVQKMSSGQPLDDHDRLPWLTELAKVIQRASRESGGVLACSALKQSYRDILTGATSAAVKFIYLKGDKELIADRLLKREGHYMPAGLLDSQFNDLEEPEDALTISIDRDPDEVVAEIMEKIE